MKVYLNGEFLPLDEARISPMDRGFIYGDGIYEGVSAYDGKIFQLQYHVDRLNRGLEFIGVKSHFENTDWQKIFDELLELNNAKKGAWFIYQQITAGYQEVRNHVRPDIMKPTVFITLKQFHPATTESLKGIKAITVDDIRWQRCDLKCTSLLGNVDAYNKAYQAGASHALMVKNGKVTEAAANNLFVVKDGIVITPPLDKNLLPGITRKVILEILEEKGIAYEQRDIDVKEIYDIDEAFATGTTSEISPIVQIDDKVIADGQIGKMTLKIFELFNKNKSV